MTTLPRHGLREALPTTAAPARDHLRRAPAPRVPRRRSVPSGHRVPPSGGAVAAPAPLALRLGRTAMRVGDARLLDRLVRGRGWIALIALGLMGIVFMQVSLLKLNAGISRDVAAGDALERQNATLRAQISSLDSGERIQDVAARLGMLMPAAGAVHFLDARGASAARAAASIRPPHPVTSPTTGAAATTTPASTITPVAAATTGTTTPATTAAATTAASTATSTTTPATTTAPATSATSPAMTASTSTTPATTTTTPTATTATSTVSPPAATTTPTGG